jgi:hypothetical protein
MAMYCKERGEGHHGFLPGRCWDSQPPINADEHEIR